jgi:CTP synthase (UTP-ammonia lyase)
LEHAGLAVAGIEAGDEVSRGEARILELQSHPFYIATLFVPQAKSSPGQPHPLIAAFLGASISN